MNYWQTHTHTNTYMDGTIGGGPREHVPPSLKNIYIYIYIGIFFTILYLGPLFQKICSPSLTIYIDFIVIAYALVVK